MSLSEKATRFRINLYESKSMPRGTIIVFYQLFLFVVLWEANSFSFFSAALRGVKGVVFLPDNRPAAGADILVDFLHFSIYEVEAYNSWQFLLAPGRKTRDGCKRCGKTMDPEGSSPIETPPLPARLS